MKSMILAMAISALGATLAVGQSEGNSPSVAQNKVTALNQKYAVLFDEGSEERETRCGKAVLALREDAELEGLRAELKGALEAPVKSGKKVSELSQRLQKKQVEKIVALHPDLAPYLEAKTKHDLERAALLKEYAGNAAAQQEIIAGTKRKGPPVVP